MKGSAGGPLGALLLIAPLAAIPVFAIIGVPQFAPLVASPSDDEEISDLGEVESSRPSATADNPRKTRSADDLYAPLDESPSRAVAGVSPRGPARQTAGAAALPAHTRNSALPPPDALDQWEIRQTAPDIYSRDSEPSSPNRNGAFASVTAEPDEGLQLPADDADADSVAPEGFSVDLLNPDRAKKAANKTDGRQVATAAKSQTRPKKPGTADSIDELQMPVDGLAQAMSEQSGWQAAAQKLKALGIRKYRLESQIEEQNFVFMCTLSSPDNPRVSRRFEADADTPLEAVQLVLEQIDEWRTRDNRAKLAAVPTPDGE